MRHTLRRVKFKTTMTYRRSASWLYWRRAHLRLASRRWHRRIARSLQGQYDLGLLAGLVFWIAAALVLWGA